ncbi:MAG: aminotransferase class V-fold PLP-dependent enzyme [Pseudomonadota bacterium]
MTQTKTIDTYLGEQFPTLGESDHALFDNAGGSLPCRSAIEAISRYLIECPVQLGASYDLSQLAGHRLAKSTRDVMRLLDTRGGNELSDEQIIFGSSTTQLINALCASLAPGFQAGDEIIVTNFDHESNIGAWRRLEERGLRVKEWQLNTDSLAACPADLEVLLSDKTRLVAFSHASNILGKALPVKALCEMIRAAGAISVVDGVAFAPHRPLELIDWGADFYVFSFYKVFGPHCAVLYARNERLSELSNLNHFFHHQASAATKLQPGAYPYELAAGASGVTDYLRKLGQFSRGSDSGSIADGWEFIAQRERELTLRALEILGAYEQVEILGDASFSDARLPLFSFTARDRTPADAPAHFEKHKIALRYGHFYAHRLMTALNLEPTSGVVRLSLAHYNTLSELERFAEALEDWLTS